jgi:hypothetical protein
MPATYQELKDQIINFVNKPDIEQTVDTFIDLAEADMFRRIRHWRMEKRSTAILSSQYTSLPDDFYEPIRMSISSGDTYRLDQESHAQILSRREEAKNATGIPKYFTIFDGAVEVFPTPADTYTLEMVYVGKIQPLSSSNTSNWVLQHFPDAYLYNSLMHSAPFLEEDTRLAVWSSLGEKAINSINEDNNRAKFGSSGLRVKIRSY